MRIILCALAAFILTLALSLGYDRRPDEALTTPAASEPYKKSLAPVTDSSNSANATAAATPPPPADAPSQTVQGASDAAADAVEGLARRDRAAERGSRSR